MSSLKVLPGYIGILKTGAQSIRCTSFSVNPNQTSTFYNHVIGLNDTVPSDDSTKGEDVGVIQTQRRIWRPSPISISGGIGFPATENSLVTFFDYAKYGNYFDIDFTYYCGFSKKYGNCRVNGFDFSIVAGDILNINTDVMGMSAEPTTPTGDYYITPEKLITWDTVSVSAASMPFVMDRTLIRGLNFKINNNAAPVYVSANPPTLLPSDLRLGMQEVSGSITIYLDSGYEYIPTTLGSYSVLTVNVAESWSTNIYVVFQSNKMEGLVGPVVTELPFVGVDKAFGE